MEFASYGYMAPSEQAWSQILRTACAAGFPSQHDTSVLRELKAKVKRGDKGAPHEVVEYPVNPTELPFYDSAYEGEELAKVDEERILALSVSLRKTNKEAKAHRSQQLGMDAPSEVRRKGLNKDQMLLMMFNAVMKQNRGQGQQEIDIEMLQPKKKVKAIEAPAPETHVADTKEQPASSAAPPAAVPARSAAPPAAVPAIEDRKAESDAHARPGKKSLLESVSEGEGADGDMGPDELVGLLKKPAANKTATQKKPAGKNQPASKNKPTSTKPVESLKKKHGWIVERRYRTDGQVDVHYRPPKGPVYRTLKEARANGYRD